MLFFLFLPRAIQIYRASATTTTDHVHDDDDDDDDDEANTREPDSRPRETSILSRAFILPFRPSKNNALARARQSTTTFPPMINGFLAVEAHKAR